MNYNHSNASKADKQDDMLQTPSPPSGTDSPQKGLTSPNTFLSNQLRKPETVRRLSEPTADGRIRMEIYVSLRNHGEKVDSRKIPKTCITQFVLNRSPLAYLNIDFYKATVTAAKNNLMTAAPFNAFNQLRGPWMPTLEFRNPMFKFPETEHKCFMLKSYPTDHDLMLIPEPYRFTTTQNPANEYQKMYVIFECGFHQKMQLQPIKTEQQETLKKHVGLEGDYNTPTNNLLHNADKALNMLDKDIQQARTEWINALTTYKNELSQVQVNALTQIQPQPYQQSLSDEAHIVTNETSQTRIPLIVTKTGQAKPNLQVQLKRTGEREVHHTPDTTGTPVSAPTEGPSAPQIQPVQMEQLFGQPLTAPMVTMTPDLFFNIIMQQQRQLAPISAHQRLGPKTPPMPPPSTPSPRPQQTVSARVQRRREWHSKQLQGPIRERSAPRDYKPPRWTSEPYRRQEDNNYHGYFKRENNARRDPRENRFPREHRQQDRTRHDQREPQQYDDRHHRMPERPAKRPREEDEDQRMGTTMETNLDQFQDFSKILNITPEKMQEAYQVFQRVLQDKHM